MHGMNQTEVEYPKDSNRSQTVSLNSIGVCVLKSASAMEAITRSSYSCPTFGYLPGTVFDNYFSVRCGDENIMTKF